MPAVGTGPLNAAGNGVVLRIHIAAGGRPVVKNAFVAIVLGRFGGTGSDEDGTIAKAVLKINDKAVESVATVPFEYTLTDEQKAAVTNYSKRRQ